jgi:hypothetical protein
MVREAQGSEQSDASRRGHRPGLVWVSAGLAAGVFAFSLLHRDGSELPPVGPHQTHGTGPGDCAYHALGKLVVLNAKQRQSLAEGEDNPMVDRLLRSAHVDGLQFFAPPEMGIPPDKMTTGQRTEFRHNIAVVGAVAYRFQELAIPGGDGKAELTISIEPVSDVGDGELGLQPIAYDDQDCIERFRSRPSVPPDSGSGVPV